MDETNLDELDLDTQQEERRDKRIDTLLSKVKSASQEREEALAKAEAAEAAKAALEKDLEFINSFSNVSAKYSAAAEYKDAIKEKVKAGYSVEDATVSVLNAEGKLSPSTPPAPPPEPAAGGSAATALPEVGNKTAKDMSQEERLAILLEAERRGDIYLA